jgi:predicted metal-dependent hydrolase
MTRVETRQLLSRLTADADRICMRFGLRYLSLEAERANVKRRYGICYSDGSIKVRLRHATTGSPLRYSSLVSTLCHELAHLRHFNHGKRFQGFYRALLEWARTEEIYRPASGRSRTRVTAGEPILESAKPRNRPLAEPVQLQLL